MWRRKEYLFRTCKPSLAFLSFNVHICRFLTNTNAAPVAAMVGLPTAPITSRAAATQGMSQPPTNPLELNDMFEGLFIAVHNVASDLLRRYIPACGADVVPITHKKLTHVISDGPVSVRASCDENQTNTVRVLLSGTTISRGLLIAVWHSKVTLLPSYLSSLPPFSDLTLVRYEL